MTNNQNQHDFLLDTNEFLSDLTEVYLSEDQLVSNFQFMKDLNIISLNIRSLNANHNELCILLDKFGSKSPHIIGLQETFKINSRSEALLNIPNYDLVYCSREKYRGGGVCFYVRNDIKFEKIFHLFKMHEGIFEAIAIDVTFRNETIRLGNFYRSDKKIDSLKSNEKFDTFCDIYDDWITKFAETNSKCLVMCDSNINHLDNCNQRYQMFKEITFCSGFIPIFRKPTRFNPRGQSTLIDNMYVNHLDVRYAQQCIDSFSDHNMLSISIKIEPKFDIPTSKIESKKRLFTPKHINKFRKNLSCIKWDYMYELDTESSSKFFTKIFQMTFEISFPMIHVKSSNKKKALPFFDEKLEVLRLQKNSCYRIYKNNPNPETMTAYKSIRNIYNSSLRKSKKEYLHAKMESLKNDPRKLWQFIGKSTNLTNASKRKKSNLDFLNVEGEIKDKPIDMANEFCKFFAETGKNLAENIPKYETDYKQFMKQRNIHSFWFEPFEVVEIANVTESLNVRHTPDLLNVTNFLLKKIACQIAISLQIIFNKSIESGIFPSSWKTSKIIPIYKGKGPLTNMSNFRPIAQIIGFTKIFEKCILNRISKFLEKSNILSPHQYAYRSGFTVQQSIVKFLNFCAENRTNDNFFSSIFIDCSKAFDSIDRNILFVKLERYGIRGNLLSWFKSYLSDRTALVQVHDAISSSQHTSDYGVLQGSSLSALLFIIYVDDMRFSVPKALTLQYADDSAICCSATNSKDLKDNVELYLNKLTEWFDANLITVNLQKTEYLLFKNDDSSKTINAYLKGRKDFWKIDHSINPIRYLGFWTDDNLSANLFFEKIINKMQFGVFILSRIKNFYPEYIKIQIFNCFIQSHLEFCSVFYYLASKKIHNKLLSLQKRGLMYVKSTKEKIHYKKLFILYDVMPVELLCKLRIFQFMYNIVQNNKLNQFCKAWCFRSDIYDGLRNAHHLNIPFAPKQSINVMPYVVFPKVYNELIDFFNSPIIEMKIARLRSKLLEAYDDMSCPKVLKCQMCIKLNREIDLCKLKRIEKKERVDNLIAIKGIRKKKRYIQLLKKFRFTNERRKKLLKLK